MTQTKEKLLDNIFTSADDDTRYEERLVISALEKLHKHFKDEANTTERLLDYYRQKDGGSLDNTKEVIRNGKTRKIDMPTIEQAKFKVYNVDRDELIEGIKYLIQDYLPKNAWHDHDKDFVGISLIPLIDFIEKNEDK